jgi:hypothetical protein
VTSDAAASVATVGRGRQAPPAGLDSPRDTPQEARVDTKEDRLQKLLNRLGTAWSAFNESYAGLPDSQLTESGALGDWSVKDIVAHVTTWEEEALKHLPLVMAGGRPPKYATIGGIDAFNASMMEQKRELSLAEVKRQRDETHRRLIDFIQDAPADQLAGDTRFRRRLRLDTYGHYPLHTEAIWEWRRRRAAG